MAETLKIAPDLQARVDALAARTGCTPQDVIADALEHGHSIDWQERFVEKVKDGIAAADAGRFASDEEVERVFNKYRPS